MTTAKEFKKEFYKSYHTDSILPHIFRGNNYEKFESSRSEAYRAYRRHWSEVPNKRLVTEFPMHISVATNNACNLRCPMCPRAYDYTLTKGKTTISLDVFKTTVDEGVANGLMAIRLNKQNEPTLTSDLPDYIDYAKSKGVLDVMINTNAVALTQRLGKDLILSGLDKINISFDSHEKEIYEGIRVGAKFEEVVDNIRNFFTLRRELDSITPLIRISRVTKSSETSKLADFTELFKEWCDEVVFTNWVNYEATPAMLKKKEISDAEIFEICGTCLQPYQRLEIDAFGNVYGCCMETEDMKLGNINESSLMTLWHGDKIKQIRRILSEKKHLTLRSCSICYAGMVCDTI
ncbi:radical SAM/SPASM domain-containing protein [Chloroflexota bacterium]